MKDDLYIKSRLNNLQTQLIPQAIEYTAPHQERIGAVMWVYNNGNIQSQTAVEVKLRCAKEELISLQFMTNPGLQLRCINARIEELENILN